MFFEIPQTSLKPVQCSFRKQNKKIPSFGECLVWEPVAASIELGSSSLLSLCFSCPSTASLYKVCQRKSDKGNVAPPTMTAGQRSDLLVRHLQELRVHVPGTLPLGVEEELVIAAVSTNRCVTQRNEQSTQCPGPSAAFIHFRKTHLSILCRDVCGSECKMTSERRVINDN